MAYDTAERLAPSIMQDERLRKQLIKSMGILAGLGAGIVSYAYFHEPLNVRFDHVSIELPNASGRLPKAGLRILHLSDTHFRGAQWREQSKINSIRRACRNLEYDLLVHTGDFLHHDSGLSNVLSLLDSLPRPRLASYAVFGNHDYMTYGHNKMLSRSWTKFCEQEEQSHAMPGQNRRTSPVQRAARYMRFGRYFMNSSLDLKRTGTNDTARLEAALDERDIQTLHNRAVRLTQRHNPLENIDLYIAGVDDVTEGLPDVFRAMNHIPYDAPTLLLSHNPDILVEPGIEQADLILAGHTHGGQVVLPWLGAASTNSDYLPRHEVAGYLQRGKTQVYISRGIGEGIPIRLGASPQIALITVKPA